MKDLTAMQMLSTQRLAPPPAPPAE
jgi:hypothetical protein